MIRKKITTHFPMMLPVSLLVLYVGIIVASLQQEQLLLEKELEPSTEVVSKENFLEELLALGSDDAVNPQVMKNNVDAYIRTYHQLSGRTDLLNKPLPVVVAYLKKVRSERQVRAAVIRRVARKKSRLAALKLSRLRHLKMHAVVKNLPSQKLFSWPVHPRHFWISSYYGPRILKGKQQFHKGIDLAAPTGTPVTAAAAGRVLEARYAPGYGNYILIAHAGNYKTRYAHLSRIGVIVGQQVEAGELIGKVGATGKVTKNRSSSSAAHLHFELYSKGRLVNPFKHLA